MSITEVKLKSRRAHRAHLRDVNKWVRDTGGQDWVLVKVHKEKHIGWVYMWAGPEGTGATQTCFGTEHSAMFLEMLKSALQAYRQEFAQGMINPVDDFQEVISDTPYYFI